MIKYFFLTTTLLTCTFLKAQKIDEEAVARMKKDVTYLASDALEGRLTGSAGEMESSKYIAKEFKKYKLKTLNDSSGYFQEFKITRARLSQLTDINIIETNTKPLTLKTFQGIYPLSQSCNDCRADANIKFIGYGIYAPAIGHNDFKDSANLKGSIVVMYIGSPDNSAHSKYDPYSEVSTKVNNAIKYGASGVIFTRINNTEKDPSGQLSVTIRPTAIPVLFVHDTTVISAIHAKIFSKVATLENTAHNVIGFKNNKKKTTIIIGAHQDHLGYNELGGSRTKEEGKIHNGADDNASGVAVMMELMRKLSKGKYKKHNYLFIAFSGEEEGLLGSNYYVKHPLIPNDKIACMLNFDMLGRLDSTKKKLMVYGVGTSPVWKPAIETISTDSFNIKIRTTESGTGSSDHTSFYYQNIPDLHFFTGQHKDYHLPSDDEALINYTGMWYSYDYIYKLIGKINKVKTIPFTPTKNNESEFVSYKVTLGIMPDYIYDGSGLRVDGVNKDRPGDKAGLKTGDIIIKLGDFPVSSVQEYMKALSEYNKGDKTTITITRGTQTMILPATFE